MGHCKKPSWGTSKTIFDYILMLRLAFFCKYSYNYNRAYKALLNLKTDFTYMKVELNHYRYTGKTLSMKINFSHFFCFLRPEDKGIGVFWLHCAT